MTNMHLGVAMALACLLASSCTAINHIESQSRLEAGITEVIKARAAAYETAKKTAPDDTLKPFDSGITPTLFSAKTALAGDATKDYETATALTGGLSTSDKVSYLYRAAIKAWHAGDAGKTSALAIYNAGTTACSGLKNSAPPRDCAMLRAVVALTKAQRATDAIIQVQIKGIRKKNQNLDDKDVRSLIGAYADLKDAILEKPAKAPSPLKQGLHELADGKIGEPLRPFIDGQIMIYRCYAFVAYHVIGDIGGGTDAGKVRLAAKDLIQGKAIPSAELSELKQLLAENKDAQETLAEVENLLARISNGASDLNTALGERGYMKFGENVEAECKKVAEAAQEANAKEHGISAGFAAFSSN